MCVSIFITNEVLIFLINMNIIDIYKLSKIDNGKSLIRFLIDSGTIAREKTLKCKKCGGLLSLDRKDPHNWRWKCHHRINRKPCAYTISITKGTLFQNSHLSFAQICIFINLWLENAPLKCISNQAGIKSSRTLVQWSATLRRVLFDHCFIRKTVIGGPGKIVEIDESKFGKRKYQRGRLVDGQWILGGIERESKKCFLVPVNARNKETLYPIITEWVRPGTTIITDSWRAYDGLDKIGFVHLKVNHSRNFVDPETGAHTNTIESIWQAVKRSFPTSGRRKHYYLGYLSRFMFLHECKIFNSDPFQQFLKAAGRLFNPYFERSYGISEMFDEAELNRFEKMSHGCQDSDSDESLSAHSSGSESD